MSTSAIEVSGEKVKAMWDKRLTEIFCDICIKEILKGNRPVLISQKMDGKDTGLGWNPIKRNVDASDDWWESSSKIRTSGIDPGFEWKLDQMYMGIVATAPSSSTLRNVNNEIPEENEEENVRNDVHISDDVQIDGNGQKRKNPEISRATRLSSQIEKLCNAADNMSQATSSLTPVIDPYGILQAIKMLNSMSEEFLEVSSLYFFALRLLLNKDKRFMFLSINPKIRALWLKTEMEVS
ncbi:hypothetical protein GOBAR_AA29191 [Gossypium barbadense]|uniref:Myb/SANT-like domain-containing protein n=1 Tax=Gossypium barbadense TaxID=3634 RepID=A0A2P5WK77_GOSBA|nr:hypothetical protein GOBAR_AA29191 [Gossypium barbadense]